MPKYANRLPKFEDTDAASGSSETTGKGKRHATKPYTRPEQSASIDLKSFGYQLNRLGSQVTAFVNSSDFAMSKEGRDVCKKMASCLQRASSYQREASEHLVDDQERYFNAEWSKREKALKEQHECESERIISQLQFEKEQALISQRGELQLEKEEAIRALKTCTICYDGEKNCTLTKCSHTFCEDCCLMLFGQTCPMCRIEVTGWMKIHWTD
ncbi:hypothetical protein DPMN_031825 [Dreissena polymorpha]|uniref:RING-type domain-containing protein n=1 Tax=Dreissena polymorpha TaxID=45954 RepID=A0A9D4M2L2_DREPO|nr:hypothetical protein DPMN_151837 [Dreissena polymorpha]KAH3798295.1 hypothetical protein DPMN_151892 [Dreissena polymorpha]KAH3838004.1 hypothetical protein DPMN_111409 [Dreissena polymorpha]KAH3868675.1 hypothetical protein DPMN_031825 [Dreissena polymorpha]